MKPKEQKPSTVFRIIDRATGEVCGSYSRAYCMEFDFTSVEEARRSNCHGVFENAEKYRIAQYEVTYRLVNDDCQPPPP